MVQFYDNIIQLADFLLKFGVIINSSDIAINTINNELPANYGLIKISGEHAEKFLQSQLTCNINHIAEQSSMAAICNIQGRVECIFRIYKLNNDFYMQIIKELLLPTIDNLSKYILRSKVKLQEIPQTTNQSHHELNLLWEIQQIAHKIPEIYLATVGKFLPHNINLIQLGAVSLNKGCYKGQAIINRIHCLGKPKKELKIISINNSKQLQALSPGDQIHNIQATIVRITTINNQYQLALIELNKYAF